MHGSPVKDVRRGRRRERPWVCRSDRRLILYVGGLAPHKNLAGLIEGFAQAVADDALDDVDLVLAGDPKGDGFHSNVEISMRW